MIEKTGSYPTDLSDSLPAYALRFKGFGIDDSKASHFEPLPAGTCLEANHPYLVQITDGQSHQLPGDAQCRNLFCHGYCRYPSGRIKHG